MKGPIVLEVWFVCQVGERGGEEEMEEVGVGRNGGGGGGAKWQTSIQAPIDPRLTPRIATANRT